MSNAIIDDDTGVAMKYIQLIKNQELTPVWIKLFVNEIGRLPQGVGGRVKGTDTPFFLPYNNIPENSRKYVTYGSTVVHYRPPKDEMYHTHLTVGVKIINYPGEVSTRIVYLTTGKISFNSTI